ncbi:MAG: hypothetical protein Q8M88_10270, partial [Phenylobacterium sp.]|uniref:hypothetical protein n=1 Tax=Phenylobacterium sp. TaxID=1871053 RepID=UPI0027362F68
YSIEQSLLSARPTHNIGATPDVLKIAFRELKFGKRAYFVHHPGGEHRFSHIYLIGENLISGFRIGRPYGSNSGRDDRRSANVKRLVARLLGLDTIRPASGARKQRIIEALLESCALEDLPPEVQELIAQHRPRRPYEHALVNAERRIPEAAEMTMAAAIGRQRLGGYRYVSPSSVYTILAHAVSQGEVAEGDSKRQISQAPIALAEQFGSLDARALTRLWKGEPGSWERALRYPGPDTENTLWFMHADFRDPLAARLWVQKRVGEWHGEAAGPVRVIRLVQSERAKGRWYLECPVLGLRCDILYLRDDRFASRQAQRLLHSSQRARRQSEPVTDFAAISAELASLEEHHRLASVSG